MVGGLKIDEKLLECVVRGTKEGLSMTQLDPDAIGVSRFNAWSRDLSVIVGLHGGKESGNVMINLSERTGLFLASRLMGEELKEFNEDAVDALCELGNMVAGRLKELLKGTDYVFEAISLPALIIGANYSLYHLKNINSLAVTFELKEMPVFRVNDKFFTTSIALLRQS
jgi:CheY-specific phosphatase CheX